MHSSSRLLVFVVLASVLCGPAHADEKFFNIALFNPVQIFDESQDVTGVRWNLIYGKNANLTGLDFGFVAGRVTGEFTGIQWNLVNLVDGPGTGWQSGLYSQARGDFLGLQTSAVNATQARGEGVQFGFVNKGTDYNGLQLGFINVTENLYGLQIGLLNIIRNKDKLPILPIVNWSF